MTWTQQPSKWNWRAYLNATEAALIEKADRSKARIVKAQMLHEEKFGRAVQLIVNRAIHRAKYEAGKHKK